jgi:transposase-like protein
MPRAYPAEFRARAVALVRAGKEQKQTAVDLGIHLVTLSKWLRQDDIDNERRPGRVSEESAELRAARRRIRELQTELEIVRKRTPTTPRQLRREGLTGLIREVHVASRGTYGYRRVHAELSEIRQRRRRGRAFPLERGHPDAPGPQAVERGQ